MKREEIEFQNYLSLLAEEAKEMQIALIHAWLDQRISLSPTNTKNENKFRKAVQIYFGFPPYDSYPTMSVRKGAKIMKVSPSTFHFYLRKAIEILRNLERIK